MGALSQLVSRFAGGGRSGGRPAGPTGHTGGAGTRRGGSQDEAIGRGVRSVLGKLRKR